MPTSKNGDEYRPMPFPSKGVDTTRAYSDQPDLTTAKATNCRFCENVGLRQRGGSRSGISKYVSAQVAGLQAIQELNMITVIEPTNTCGLNYQDGTQFWRVMSHAGTYILCQAEPESPLRFSISTVIGLTDDGTIHPGTIIGGNPLGIDQPPIEHPVDLVPFHAHVVAYWEPGAFPDPGNFDILGSDRFPGLGYMEEKYPGGFIRAEGVFNFPDYAFDLNSQVAEPLTPFWWNWNTGCPDAGIDPVFRRAFVVTFRITITDAPGQSTTVKHGIAINGTTALSGILTSGQGNEEYDDGLGNRVTRQTYLILYDERALEPLSIEALNLSIDPPVVAYQPVEFPRALFLEQTSVLIPATFTEPSDGSGSVGYECTLWFAYSSDVILAGLWQWVEIDSLSGSAPPTGFIQWEPTF